MPLITDWLMVGITLVYVVATIMICVFNGRSAKATREQVSESQRQFEETKRLGYRPYFDILPADNNFEYNIYDTEITLHIISTRPLPDIFSSMTVFIENEVNAKKTVITNDTESR